MPDDVTPIKFAPSELVNSIVVSLDVVRKAVAWDKKHKVSAIRHHVQLKEIAEGQKKLNEYNLPTVNYMINKLSKQGFNVEN